MANESSIDELINRSALKSDIDYAIEQVERLADSIKAIKAPRLDIVQGKGDMQEFTKQLEAAANAAVKSDKTISDLTKRLKDLEAASKGGGKATKLLTDEQARLQAETQKANAATRLAAKEAIAAANSYEALATKLNRLKNENSKLDLNSEQYKKNELEIAKLVDTLKGLDAAQGNFQRNVGNYSGALGVLQKQLASVRQQQEGLKNAQGDNAAALAALNKEEALLASIVERQAGGFLNMQQEIKSNTTALQQLASQGLQNSEVYKELFAETGRLKDSFSDLQDELKNETNNQSFLDKALSGAKELAAVYSVAEGATALFGEGQEALAEASQKIIAVQGVINGLFEIQEALKIKDGIVSKVAAAGQLIYATAVGASTGAMKAFRIALLATGIGAVIALLVLAADAMGAFDDSAEDANGTLEEQKTVADSLVSSLGEIVAATNRVRAANKGGADDLQRMLALTRARGGSAKEVFDIEQKIREEERKALASQAYALTELYTVKKQSGQLTEALAEEINAKVDALNKAGLDKANDIEAARLSFATEQAKARYERIKDYSQRELQAQYDIIRLKLEAEAEYFKELSEEESESAAARLQSLIYYAGIEEQIIKGEVAFLLKNDKLTVSEREKIRVEADLKLLDISKATSAIRKKIVADSAANEKAEMEAFAADFIQDVDKLKAKIEAESEKNTLKMFELNDEEYTTSLEALAKRYKDGIIDYKKYQEDKEKLDKEFSLREISRLQIVAQANYEVLQATLGGQADATKKALAALNSIKRAYIDLDNTITGNGGKTPEEKRLEKLEKAAKDIGTATTFAQSAIGAVSELASIKLDRESAQLEEKNAQQEKNYEAEVKRISALNISDQQRADMLSVLEAQRNAEKQETERKIRKIEVERARYEKAANIANIISSTALAVVNALKTSGPLGIALAVAVGALGAAQLARAIATPLPKYEKGTQNAIGGPSIVGEAGVERVEEPSGAKWYTNSTAHVVNLKKGSKVIPHHQLVKEGLDMMFSATMKPMQPYSESSSSNEYVSAIEGKMDSLIQAVTNKPVAHFNNSWRGIENSIQSGNNWLIKKSIYNS